MLKRLTCYDTHCGALMARGVGVMRFDFTGLGNSKGGVANTNFSSNVGDLVAAVNWSVLLGIQ